MVVLSSLAIAVRGCRREYDNRSRSPLERASLPGEEGDALLVWSIVIGPSETIGTYGPH
jgi:hypothetical protein